MKEIRFVGWAEALDRMGLPERQKRSWEITLRWYLSFCRRSRAGVTVQSARDFIVWVQAEKRAQEWQVEGWKGNIEHPMSNTLTQASSRMARLRRGKCVDTERGIPT